MVHMIETNALPAGHSGIWAAPFLADLVFLLDDEAAGLVTCEILDAAGLSGAQALQNALGRFAEAGHQTKMGPAPDNAALFCIEVAQEPNLTPMLLAMPTLFDEVLQATGQDAVLITHPDESRIFVGPSGLDGVEDMMMETLNRAVGQALRQSDYVFRLNKGGALTPTLFLPAGGAPQRVEDDA